MGYGTGYLDTITNSGNLTIINNTVFSGNISGSGNISSADGILYPLLSSSTVNSTSGTTITIATNIPSWVKRINVIFSNTSLSGTSLQLLQLGYGSTPTYQTTGYSSVGDNYSTAATTVDTSTAGFVIGSTSAATTVWNIMYTIVNVPGTNTYIGSFSGGTAATVAMGGGTVTLSNVLTAIRVTSVNGTDTFDSGTINIMYE